LRAWREAWRILVSWKVFEQIWDTITGKSGADPMPQKTLPKRKVTRKKPKMQEYELVYHLQLPFTVTIDEFVERMVELVESLGGYIGGGAIPATVKRNGKEKRHQRPANQP
jgi:hypothetical protein